MTRKLGTVIPPGTHLEVWHNGNKVLDVTLPNPVVVTAQECVIVNNKDTILVKTDGVTRLEYTVPDERRVLVTWEVIIPDEL